MPDQQRRAHLSLRSDGQPLALSSNDWWFALSDAPEDQSYDFYEILADHTDYVAQDMGLDDEGNLSQYIGAAYFYYTYVDPATGETRFASRSDYEAQMEAINSYAGGAIGPAITKHRGVLEVSIAPERLRSIAEIATLDYVADHTTIHGTGHTVICDTSEEHRCIYSPREADIGKTASAMGYSPLAFNETGEMYNGFETVNGVKYFQTFKMVDEQDAYIGTAVPMETVYATRNDMTLITFLTVLIGFAVNFLYTCSFGQAEELMYQDHSGDPDWHLRNEKDLVTITMPSGKVRKARTAASRWDAEYVPWYSKTPEQKFGQIVRWAFDLFAYLLFLCIILSRSGVVAIDAINYVYEGVWTKGLNIFAMTNGAITLIVVFVIARVGEMVIDNLCVNLGSRAETLGHLISSIVHYGVGIFAVFYILYLCGLDTGSLIASAGILSLVIGLGAQSMIQDLLAGIFIVFEGAFRVGDIVTIGDFRGNVLEIGLRTTKIEDPAKNIKVFNNSTLSGIINMTKEASYASIDVGIAYGEDIRKVEEVLKRELPLMKKRLPAIMDGPYYRGVSELAASSVNIKLLALCKEADRIQLCRDMNREMLIILQDNGIDIPFPQVTVSYLDGGEAGKEETADAPGSGKESSPGKDGESGR